MLSVFDGTSVYGYPNNTAVSVSTALAMVCWMIRHSVRMGPFGVMMWVRLASLLLKK